MPSGTYTIMPVGQEMTNGAGLDTTTFGTPGNFTLTINAAPEPAAVALWMVGAGTILLRRRVRGSRIEKSMLSVKG